MRLCRKPPREITGLNMTAMIDIVFLLIIFFMTVSRITQDRAAEVRLPEVVAGVDTDLAEPLDIAVLRDGTVLVDGLATDLAGTAGRVAAIARGLAVAPQTLVIQLRVDRECDSAVVNRLLKELEAAGIQRVFAAVLVE